jgi:hypothetical protein
MLQTKITGATCTPNQKPEAKTQHKGGRIKGTGKEETAGNMRNTRSTDIEGSWLSREEIELLPGQEITDVIEGMRCLESTILTVPGVPYTATILTGALCK